VAAEQGGAHRVEGRSDLAEAGITPSAGLVAMVRKRIAIGWTCWLVRACDFCYSADEFEVMTRDILPAKQPGARASCSESSLPLHVTFPRGFDMTPGSSRLALEAVQETGA